jgi:23S rRNA pseudouridine1911/1915/1917 synthase
MIDILYEDNHLIAVNKPAGMLTQPTDRETESLETAVKAWLKEKHQKPGNVFLGVVHRLDRPVSGIILFAKTSKALSRINAAMRERKFNKTYCALVEGRMPEDKGTLENYLRHGDYLSVLAASEDREAKLAKLHYEVLQRFESTTLLKVDLETGRYHQIRVQFAAAGHPIIGDIKYGSRTMLAGGSIALHHSRLQLIHPVTGQSLVIESPLPKILQ